METYQILSDGTLEISVPVFDSNNNQLFDNDGSPQMSVLGIFTSDQLNNNLSTHQANLDEHTQQLNANKQILQDAVDQSQNKIDEDNTNITLDNARIAALASPSTPTLSSGNIRPRI